MAWGGKKPILLPAFMQTPAPCVRGQYESGEEIYDLLRRCVCFRTAGRVREYSATSKAEFRQMPRRVNSFATKHSRTLLLPPTSCSCLPQPFSRMLKR